MILRSGKSAGGMKKSILARICVGAKPEFWGGGGVWEMGGKGMQAINLSMC